MSPRQQNLNAIFTSQTDRSCVVAKDLVDDDENDLHAERAAGWIDGVGWRFQSFGINDLEMVDLTGIEPVTS